MSGRRVDGWGRIDRDRPLSLTFDGAAIPAFAGDTVASALLAAGATIVSHSVRFGRPRGIMTAGVEEPTGLVQVTRPYDEPMLTATTVEVMDEMAVESLGGQGRLNPQPDTAAYDAMNAHCEVLVVGAGRAGLTAAIEAADDGCRVMIMDERPVPGGSALTPDALTEIARLTDRLDRLPNVRRLARTTVTGCYDSNYLVALERRRDHDDHGLPDAASRHRVWRVRAGRVVLATGTHERPVAFAGNDVPGVMLAGAVRTYLHRYGVRCGDRVVVFAADDHALAVADDLRLAGAEVTVVDPRTDGAEVVGTETDHDGVLSAVLTGDGGRIEADLLAVSGGRSPALQLYSQGGGRLWFDDALGAFVPDPDATPLRPHGLTVVGSAAGTPVGRARPLFLTGTGDPRSMTDAFVDLQRDVSVAELVRATGTGMTSIEHVKRYTTAGTAHDQGKTSGTLASAVVAQLLGVATSELGTTTFRPPYVPIAFAALAGRERGALYDPVRTTAVHDWHVAHGALFEDVGQWKRPWYYPRDREDLHAAVLRECAAVRTGVGFLDGSTLGTIDLRGTDTAEFLDLIYTNLMSTLEVGMIRYGVMCSPDGMVLDDGTAIRLADHHFLITTTTGNAAAILDWLEEWLQTEWPQLDVTCTSVTEQWATMALAGPRSRDLLAGLAPTLDVSAAGFGFMAWRDTTVAGLPARVCRISFSGELAYEINVAWSDAPALWAAVWTAGEPLGLTPYGTETMHVLRAEKGYPIIGQDTDGTVTPQDLGMSWVVSKKKTDFLGKRSHARAGNACPDRKHLVALLPDDHRLDLPEGSQLVEHAELPPLGPGVRVPMLGFVTSAYRSAALERTFGLALLQGGRERIGDRVHVVVDGVPQPVTVAATVLVDPDGLRRDGDPGLPEPVAPTEPPAFAPGPPVSPLQTLAGELSVASGPAVTITELPHRTMINLRLRLTGPAAGALGAALGCPVPAATDETTAGDDVELLALGPDELLLVAAPGTAHTLMARLDAVPEVAATDVSAARTIVELTGPRTRELLAQGCAIDLDRLGPGRCAQTWLARCAVILAPDPDGLRVLVRSSFAHHLARWLLVSVPELNAPYPTAR